MPKDRPHLVGVPSETPEAPYGADIKANGYPFSLDMQRISQSDTWLMAGPELRPWLLMLWSASWLQFPCGSLPASDESIALRIGQTPQWFRAHRHILMRGWQLHADGRLYHSQITAMVLHMTGKRRCEVVKKQRQRKQALESNVPGESRDVPCGSGSGSGSRSTLSSSSSLDLDPTVSVNLNVGGAKNPKPDGRAEGAPQGLPSRIKSPKPKTTTSQGCRLPHDELPADWRQWALDNRPDLDPDKVWPIFHDYWASKPGKDGRKVDWLATWRNWMRRTDPGHERNGKSLAAPPKPSPRRYDPYGNPVY